MSESTFKYSSTGELRELNISVSVTVTCRYVQVLPSSCTLVLAGARELLGKETWAEQVIVLSSTKSTSTLVFLFEEYWALRWVQKLANNSVCRYLKVPPSTFMCFYGEGWILTWEVLLLVKKYHWTCTCNWKYFQVHGNTFLLRRLKVALPESTSNYFQVHGNPFLWGGLSIVVGPGVGKI